MIGAPGRGSFMGEVVAERVDGKDASDTKGVDGIGRLVRGHGIGFFPLDDVDEETHVFVTKSNEVEKNGVTHYVLWLGSCVNVGVPFSKGRGNVRKLRARHAGVVIKSTRTLPPHARPTPARKRASRSRPRVWWKGPPMCVNVLRASHRRGRWLGLALAPEIKDPDLWVFLSD